MKAFLCIHGFGKHQAGFSESMRREVEALLGARTVWKEILWGDLLGSPASFHLATMAAETPKYVRAFYEGPEGDAVRARVAETVRTASAEADGWPVVLVGHSLGAAIAYETLARCLAPEARALVMLAPPMGLFNHPETFPTSPPDYPRVEGDRLPEDVFALSFPCSSSTTAHRLPCLAASLLITRRRHGALLARRKPSFPTSRR